MLYLPSPSQFHIPSTSLDIAGGSDRAGVRLGEWWWPRRRRVATALRRPPLLLGGGWPGSPGALCATDSARLQPAGPDQPPQHGRAHQKGVIQPVLRWREPSLIVRGVAAPAAHGPCGGGAGSRSRARFSRRRRLRRDHRLLPSPAPCAPRLGSRAASTATARGRRPHFHFAAWATRTHRGGPLAEGLCGALRRPPSSPAPDHAAQIQPARPCAARPRGSRGIFAQPKSGAKRSGEAHDYAAPLPPRAAHSDPPRRPFHGPCLPACPSRVWNRDVVISTVTQTVADRPGLAKFLLSLILERSPQCDHQEVANASEIF